MSPRRSLPALTILLALLALVAASSLTSAARGGRDEARPPVPKDVREALLFERWDDALTLLDAHAAARPEEADTWLFLRGHTLALAGRAEEAQSVLGRLTGDYAESGWIHKARFLRAELLAGERRFAEAEAIWEAEARRLRSEGRQGELADVYIRFADQLSIPPATPTPEASTLDYDRARDLYTRVLELDAPAAKRAWAAFRIGVCLQELGRWGEAAAAYQRYLAEFDPTRGGAGEPGRVFEARYRLGVCQRDGGDPVGARRTFEDLIAATPDALAGRTPWAAPAAEARVEIERRTGDARFAIAETYAAQGGAQLRLAIAAYERFLTAHPAHPRASLAAVRIASAYEQLGRFEDALAAYDAFLARALAPEATDEVRTEHAELMMRALFDKGRVLARQARYERAIEVFAEYTRRYPTGPQWSEAQQGIVDSEYLIGAAHLEEQRFDEARQAWTRFLEAHPLDPRAREVQVLLGELYAAQAALAEETARAGETAPGSADVEALYRAAVAQWRKVAQKYPNTDEASRALFRSGVVLETELSELEEALAAYRACTFGAWAGHARQRVEAMTQPSLSVLTERSWRSNEAARVALRVRNVEEVQVEVYVLDLEAYFRKHLTHRDVEELDLDLIAADHSFDVAVEGYRPYLPIESEVELPVEGPGVWAVAVTAGDKRATTLVVRSDVDVLVKSSRREVFVFAQDVLAGAPAGGVRVLVALPGAGPAGASVMKELATDAGGVARLALEELFSAGAVRVFAARDGHVASDGLELSGLARSAGLSPRGLVYTDRPAYRPGTQVRWRAVLREVQDGSYVFEPGSTVLAEVVDSQGRTIQRRSLALSAYGTVHGELELPDEAPEGDWQVRVQRPNGPAFTGAFAVREYRLQKIELAFELERDVYYRGEEVEVGVQARYYYGEPVVDSPLRYRLPDGRVGETRTDAEGKASLRFDTRELASEGELVFEATLTEERVSRTGSVWLAVHGFGASLSGPERVVLVGEPFGVTLHTFSPAGEDVSRAMELTVLRRESRPGQRWSEVLVARHELTTGEDDGRAVQTLALDTGGWYVLRAEGTDRFGNPVTAELRQFVSGADDDDKLRVLVDGTRVTVGEEVRARVLDRVGPGLALVTFEGETVLEHRVIELAEGENPLAFTVPDDHFPSFELAVAMMRPGELWQGRAAFTVRRELRVELAPASPVVAPGEEAEVRVKVTDLSGEPVRAELSLAVVDEALFELYADATPPIVEFFQQGAQRQAGLSTSSSCTFRYEGHTAQIAAAVLAQRELQEAEGAWAETRQNLVDRLAKLESAAQEFDVALGEAPAEPASEALRFQAGEMAALRQAGGGPSTPGPAGPRSAYARGRLGLADKAKAVDEEGAAAELGSNAVTAFWSATIATDDAGLATVRFDAPDKSTRWRLTARGADAGSLFGEARAELVTRADFFVEVRTPPVLVLGDAPRFAVRVHNLTGLAGTADLKLRITAGGDTRVLPARVALGAEGVVEHLFEAVPTDAAGAIALEAEAQATLGARTVAASVRDEVQVRPFGVEYADTAGGVLRGPRTVWLELPRGREYAERELELFVGPSVDRLLVDLALGRDAALAQSRPVLGDAWAGTASELLATCAVLRVVGGAERETNPDYARLREVAEARVAELVAGQERDGGWSWARRRRASAPEATSRVLLALARAAEAGVAAPPETVDGAVRFLQQAFQRASQQADEEKAMMLYALAAHERGDFGAANRLHRERSKLSPAALAYTTLALLEMGRDPMAAEVAAALEAAALVREEVEIRCFWPTGGNIGWNRSRVEMAALGLQALLRALPASPRVTELAAELHATRPWRQGRERGMAVAALAEQAGRVATSGGKTRVTVRVLGGEPRVLELDPGRAGEGWRVPLEGVPVRRIKIELEVAGAGRPHFAAVLRGFGDVDPKGRDSAPYLFSRQEYLASPPLFDGQPVRTGFGVLRRSNGQWTNTTRHLPLGHTAEARLYFYRPGGSLPEREAEYMVLEVPLPAGTRVLEGSFGGALGTYEERPGKLVVPVGPLVGGQSVQFTLIGAEPGRYRVLPPVLRSLHDPAHMAVGRPMELDVLPRGTPSPDEYRPTPDELFNLGKALYEADEKDGAWARLTALFEGYEPRLHDQALKEAGTMLLFMSIERGEAASIVRYFEVVKERDPELYVPFEKVVAIGEAYRELEEYERAMLIFRATVEETFGKDLKVAGALEEQGDFAGAVETLDRLWAEYPDFPTVVETRLTLSDKLLKKAPEAAKDESLKRAGRDRASLTLEGVRLLQDFLALYPQDPLAPDAGLNLVGAWLALEDDEKASTLAGDLARRFEEPRWRDAFLYTRAVAEWYLGDEEEATGLLERIATATYTDDRGVARPSENRDLALYILGQIHHARQEAEKASEYYERVKDLFPDAREALAGFRAKEIALPEVTTARPGETAKLEVTYKNLKEAELLVYAVDLMTLYLRERNLSNVTEVNLAGIAPTLRTTVALGAGEDLRPQKAEAALALNEPGAYLVIARGDALHASGLVLVSDLELDVAEEPGSGAVRVQALHKETGRYLRGVDVRVIGSSNSEFIKGETDPRGLFLADGVSGRSTVIARLDERQYAFHRGRAELGEAARRRRGGEERYKSLDQDGYLKNILDMNKEQQAQRGQRLENEIRRERKGVQVQQVK